MPVELPLSGSSKTDPPLPSTVVWLGLSLVVMLVGVIGGLLTWPKIEPTGSAWFWARIVVLPALGACITFSLRQCRYDSEINRVRAEEETYQEDREEAVQFAAEPLAVLGCAYLSASGSAQVAGKIVQGDSALGAQSLHPSSDAVRHTSLVLLDAEEGRGRYGPCFTKILDLMAEAVAAVPRNVPLGVRLHLPADTDQHSLLATWHECWEKKGLRRAKAKLLPPAQGLMTLDEWLDVPGGPSLEKCILFVSVQLHDIPPENSAEAAAALLLGWAPLAGRRGMKPLAFLHRPVEAESMLLNDAIPMTLLWGETNASHIGDLWQAGLKKEDKPALIQSTSDLSLGISQTVNLSGIHDIDRALGNSGVAAGWLAAALAIEHAAQSGKPQLIAWREGSLRLAVAQPPMKAIEVESKV